MDVMIDNLYVTRELYSMLFGPICAKYRLTRAEMLVLLFLSKSSRADTATDIVETFKITKSHVSASVRDLIARGYLESRCDSQNHRKIHLRLRENADAVIQEGHAVQEAFLNVLCRGFSEEDRLAFRSYLQRINHNANEYFNEHLNAKGAEPAYAELEQHH